MELKLGMKFKCRNNENSVFYTIDGLLRNIISTQLTVIDPKVEIRNNSQLYSVDHLKRGFESGLYYLLES